jgi:DNA-binding SARP family transcriptional activator/ABC-type transport system substrate-binding protein
VQFEVLGPFRLVSEGEEVAAGGTKQRAVLAMLVLAANGRVSRDRLIEGLWGENPPASAEHTLDGYISRLRKAIGPGRIERVSSGYRLRIDAGELDLGGFEDIARQGHAALAAGDSAAAAASLAAALALWRGPALADLLDEPFAAPAAAELEERRLSVLEERTEADLANGEGPSLVPELERLARAHPFRERFIASLMLALYRAGRQAAALEVYRDARRRFSEQLGLEPGRRLQELEHAILEHDPKLGAPSVVAEATQASHVPTRWKVLVGTVIAGMVVAAGLIATVDGDGRHHARATGVGAVGNLVRLDESGVVEQATQVTSAPAAVLFAAGSIWISDTAHNQLLRTDPQSGAVSDRIPLPAQPGELAAGGGSVWVSETGGSTIIRVNEATDAITQTIRLGSSPAGLAFGAGALWVGDPVDLAVLRIDGASGSIDRTIGVGIRPAALAASAGRIWVAGYDTGTVVQVDARSAAAIAIIHVGQGPSALAFSAGRLWVANRLDGTVSEVDPASARMVRTLPTGSAPIALSASGNSVWVANAFSHAIAVIDATRGELRSQTALRGQPIAIAHVPGSTSRKPSVWVAAIPPSERRGGTLVLLDTRRFASIDPQVDYEATPAGFLGLVNDTLVAFDHTTGAAGFQLVPDLALRLPETRDAGRTIVFQLRPGVRYSNGRIVRASDFARSMSRMFRVRSPGSSLFSAVDGAGACLRDPSGCRLPRGVMADDRAGTVTFHLRSADSDFLFKLALGFVVPIPPGTSMREVTSTPIVGTGPYVFAHVGTEQFTFARNPRFKEWSHAAQPDGAPDRIVWRFGLTPDQELHAVATGHGDWTGDFPSNIEYAARNYAANLHSNVFPGLYFVQLNTRRPPFDDIRVRRALNFGVDRSAVVRLSGGSILNAPLCQIIPPGLPGYDGYCPYTRGPTSNGRWRAPALDRANRLVTASGTRGQKIVVWSISDSSSAEPAAPYLASVLRLLGYRATVKVVTTQRYSAMSPATRAEMQLHLVTFGPDYPSASEIYSLFIACHGAITDGTFCDPQLDRSANRAEALRQTNPRKSALLWAKLDRTLVDRAIWVPLTTQRILDFVSSRLRDYQFSPVYHFLPAQASVR